VSFTGVADPSARDMAAGFTYSFDLDNDGSFEVTGSSPTAAIPLQLLANSGPLPIHGRVHGQGRRVHGLHGPRDGSERAAERERDHRQEPHTAKTTSSPCPERLPIPDRSTAKRW